MTAESDSGTDGEAPRVVRVTWLDAWLDVGEASEVDEHGRVSIGFLIKNGPKIVRICQTWDSRGGDDHLTIPTPMVQRIESLAAGEEIPIGKG
jgi:hypothetical protein